MKKSLFINLFVVLLLSNCTVQTPTKITSNPLPTMDAIDAKVAALMSKMTLEEKIGQMNQYNGFWEATGPAPEAGDAKWKYDDLKKGWVGSVLNVRGAEQVRAMQKIVVEESRLGIPLIFGSDVIHGYKTYRLFL